MEACSPTQIQRYRSRISGPLLDRIDIQIEAPALSIEALRTAKRGESSEDIWHRIQAARQIQQTRFLEQNFSTNANMTESAIETYCPITSQMGAVLQTAMERLSLSARAYNRILKVSQTIADLEQSEVIELNHLTEAIQ